MMTKSQTIRKKYIVTEDLYHLMSEWRKKQHPKWKELDPAFFRALSDQLQENLQTLAFPDTGDKGYKIEVSKLDRERLNILDRDTDSRRSFWIGLDTIYVQNADSYLDITRIWNFDGMWTKDSKPIGVGLRPTDPVLPNESADLEVPQEADQQTLQPAYKSIDTRVCEIRDAYRRLHPPPDDVVLADDGTITGKTIVEVINLLAQKHIDIRVTEIRLGFATTAGEKAIEKLCDRLLLRSEGEVSPVVFEIYYRQNINAVHDWVCERDFYLGVPRSGRTLGFKEAQDTDPVPFENPGISYPYVHGFGNVLKGANIEKGRYELGKIMLESSVKLWQHLEWSAGKSLLIEDLPRFPGPGAQSAAKNLGKERAIDYLKNMYKLHYGPFPVSEP